MFPGPSELIVILLIVVVVFGAKRIPEIMGGVAHGIKSFKKAMEGEETPPPGQASENSPPASQPQIAPHTEVPPREKTGTG